MVASFIVPLSFLPHGEDALNETSVHANCFCEALPPGPRTFKPRDVARSVRRPTLRMTVDTRGGEISRQDLEWLSASWAALEAEVARAVPEEAAERLKRI
jgi:hypothetical protein